MSDSDKKKIYKSYLQSVGNFRGEDITLPSDEKIKYPESVEEDLQVLEKFFSEHPHINIDMFMEAPYKVYSNKTTSVYPLSFYRKPLALTTYFMYKDNLDEESPDSNDNLMLIKESIIFIKNFCIEKEIQFKDYLNYSESATYSWCHHLMDNKISIYSILGYSFFGINIYMMLNQLPPDERELFLYKYNEDITNYINKLNDSKKAKLLILRGYEKIKKIIDDKLKK